MSAACLICERVALAKEGRNQHLFAEMDHSYFVVGDHRFHQAYALALLKEHVREPFDLPPHVQREHFREVMRAAEAINNTFQPWKDELLVLRQRGATRALAHRSEIRDDPPPGTDPWQDIARLSERTITADQAREIAARIRPNFA